MTETNTVKVRFTKKAYMAGECTHEQYYAQFITDDGIHMVQRSTAFKRMIKKGSKDTSSVEVQIWDLIGTDGEAVTLLKSMGDCWSMSAAVCINKAIALQLLETA